MNIYEPGEIIVGPTKVMVNTVLEFVIVYLIFKFPTELPLTKPIDIVLVGVGLLKDAGSAIPEKTS